MIGDEEIRNKLFYWNQHIEFDQIDRSFDKDKCVEYLNSINDPIIKELVKQIIDSTHYIDFKTFYVEICHVAQDLCEKSSQQFSVFIDLDDPYHSEFLVFSFGLVNHT